LGETLRQRLELAGEQRNPFVSGGLVAFESVAEGELNGEVMVYHIATNRLFGITSVRAPTNPSTT
jgi:hypothetical protein